MPQPTDRLHHCQMATSYHAISLLFSASNHRVGWLMCLPWLQHFYSLGSSHLSKKLHTIIDVVFLNLFEHDYAGHDLGQTCYFSFDCMTISVGLFPDAVMYDPGISTDCVNHALPKRLSDSCSIWMPLATFIWGVLILLELAFLILKLLSLLVSTFLVICLLQPWEISGLARRRPSEDLVSVIIIIISIATRLLLQLIILPITSWSLITFPQIFPQLIDYNIHWWVQKQNLKKSRPSSWCWSLMTKPKIREPLRSRMTRDQKTPVSKAVRQKVATKKLPMVSG